MGKKNFWQRALKFSAFFMVLFIFDSPQFSLNASLEELYWNANFSEILSRVDKGSFSDLSMDDRLLVIECLARTGQGLAAQKRLEQIVPGEPFRKNFFTSWGWVYLSRGRFTRSRQFINRARAIDDQHPNAVIAEVMLLLYLKQWLQAQAIFEQWLERNPRFLSSFQIFQVGIEVYNATRDLNKLQRWYSRRAKTIRNQDRLTFNHLKSSARIYRKIRKNRLFEVKTESDCVELPLGEFGDNRYYYFFYGSKKNSKFRIILDTGNATGWIVHDRELFESLNIERGGRTIAFIGSEADSLDGYRISTESLDFGDFQLNHLTGFYIPKPRSDFFDANLNPVFIRNRVVSLDGPGKRFILRKKSAFDRYISKKDGSRRVVLPWLGYEQPFFPLRLNGFNGLGIIETGARDIGILLDFARLLELPLKPGIRYLANGKVYRFFKTPATIHLGALELRRNEAEVWSFDRFYQHLTGLKADVVLGPMVFWDTCILSFDPFEKTVVFEW